MSLLRLQFSKGAAKAVAATLGVALTGIASVNKPEPGQFALRETFYATVSDEILEPGIHPQVPFVQYTHVYDSRTQSISFNAGSCRFIAVCDSTADQNPLIAEVTLNYKVLKDREKLTFHRWAMEGIVMQDGYWLLTDMMNISANAVLGKKAMAQNLADPQAFLNDFYDDLSIRLTQNNVPVEIEGLELHSLKSWYTPTRTVAYVKRGDPAAVSPFPQSDLR